MAENSQHPCNVCASFLFIFKGGCIALTSRQNFSQLVEILNYKKSYVPCTFSSIASKVNSSLSMAYKTVSSLLAQIFILSILLAVRGQALAGRGNPKTDEKADVKQPEWLLNSDGSLLIPGIGRVMVPPGLRTHFTPYPGSGSPAGTGAIGGHVPGGDDTFVPNPGFEVPSPGIGVGGFPANAHP